MSQNIASVILQWEGKRTPAASAASSLQRFEMAARHGAAERDNRLYQGENLAALGDMAREYAGKVDCIYIDPPFNSSADYAARVRLHGTQPKTLVLRQYRDRWSDSAYLQFMFERLIVLRDLLADTGSLFLHCDWHAAAALRLVCDQVFGSKNLINEIIWTYGSGGGSKRAFGHKHDTILFYARNRRRYFFNPDAVRVPYRAVIAKKRQQLFHPDGMVCPDVWDITRPPNHSPSWVGYPTQKPTALVSRALAAACPEQGLVLDCFAGSGTTLVAAAQSGRRFLGAENSSLGVHLAIKRLRASGANVSVYREAGILPPEGHVRVQCSERSLTISEFAPAALLEALNRAQIEVADFQEMIDTVAIDTNAAHPVFTPEMCFAPPLWEFVPLDYLLPEDAAAVTVALTDVTGETYLTKVEP